ncbi:hypothetical protein ACLBYF_05810 [Methylobacterium brachiatum]|uniref:hypothetical protein n=1 Tax=Methylobacterium sp. 092160098-2 TaxID=3025129 RepID=UPI002381B72D|nr:hypothetical protein [Methylobacterium sp. 092160098-2]MDE4914810.1 hypothetical protein [Methylobacterium sp. 092160098-2]
MKNTLSEVDRQALAFLTQGPDAPGEVVDEATMCAHLVYIDLVDRGLAAKEMGEDGPVYSITDAGAAALAAPVLN